MSKVSDIKDFIEIIETNIPALRKYVFCKNTKNILNSGYKEIIVLNKFLYYFQVARKYLFQLYIVDISIILLNEFIVLNIPIEINVPLKFAILLLESVLILNPFDEIYKENLVFLFENRKEIKTPNIILTIHFLLYLFSFVLIMIPVSYQNKVGLFLILSIILFLVIIGYNFKTEKEVNNKVIYKTNFVQYGYIYLKRNFNKTYKIDMSKSNILIRNNDDIYVYLKEPITEKERINIYNVNIELIKDSLKIEKTKIDYIQIGKDKVRYRNGLWKIEEKT